MTSNRLQAILGFFVAFGACSIWPGHLPAEEQKLAIIDIVSVFDRHPGAKDFNENELRKVNAARREGLRKLGSAVANQANREREAVTHLTMDAIEPYSLKAIRAIKVERAKTDALLVEMEKVILDHDEWSKQGIDKVRNRILRDIYQHVRQFGKEKRMTCILHPGGDLATYLPSVVYHDRTLDVTDAFLKWVEKRWAERGGDKSKKPNQPSALNGG